MPPIEVTDLEKKLPLLCQYRSAVIKNQEALSVELGIKAQSITGWKKGQEGVRPKDMVPDKHIGPICRVFGISEALLLSSYEVFEKNVTSNSIYSGNDHWGALRNEAKPTDAIVLQHTSRLIQKDKYQPLPSFNIEEEVYLSFQLKDDAAPWARVNQCHLILLWITRDGHHCLFPSNPDSCLTETKLTLPADAPDNCLIVTGAPGVQSVLAILTEKSFPTAIYDELINTQTIDHGLNQVAIAIQSETAGDWRLLEMQYYVH